jgi:hypothetical protein
MCLGPWIRGLIGFDDSVLVLITLVPQNFASIFGSCAAHVWLLTRCICPDYHMDLAFYRWRKMFHDV